MSTATAKAPTQVTTGEVRLSYFHGWEPHSQEEGKDKKYSTAILIKKSDKQTIALITAAVEAAKQAGVASKWNGKMPPAAKLKLPLRDGDDEKPDDPNYAGCFFLNCSSTNPPGICKKNEDGLLEKIVDRGEVYSGCFARVSMNAFPYNSNGSVGVAFGLNNILFKRAGDALGGGTRPEQDFADELEEAEAEYDPMA